MLFPVRPSVIPIGQGARPAPVDLLTGLVAYWTLDEASGSRADSVGSNTLTDNNTVTQGTGKVGNCGQFTRANSEYLSRASTADVTTGNVNFTISAWVYMDSKPAGIMNIISKWSSVAANREYDLKWDNSSDKFIWTLSTGVGVVSLTANAIGAPSLSTWYHVVAWQDVTNSLRGIAVNTLVNTASLTTVVPTSTAQFDIGELDGFGAGFRCWNGRIDEVGLWKKVLSSAERSALYNAGAGKTYPF